MNGLICHSPSHVLAQLALSVDFSVSFLRLLRLHVPVFDILPLALWTVSLRSAQRSNLKTDPLIHVVPDFVRAGIKGPSHISMKSLPDYVSRQVNSHLESERGEEDGGKECLIAPKDSAVVWSASTFQYAN